MIFQKFENFNENELKNEARKREKSNIIDKDDLKMHWNQDKDIIVEYTPLNNKKDWTNHWETMTKPSILDVKNNRSPFFSIY